MRKSIPAIVATLLVLFSGCPHNNYEVTLTPHGDTVERTVAFYRSDGERSTPGNIKYLQFDPENR